MVSCPDRSMGRPLAMSSCLVARPYCGSYLQVVFSATLSEPFPSGSARRPGTGLITESDAGPGAATRAESPNPCRR